MTDQRSSAGREPPHGRDENYLALQAAHEGYLRAIHDIADPMLPGGALGRTIAYSLFKYILQLGRATHALVELGYGDEAQPVVRAMISATVNLVFIVESNNPDGWALRYWLELTAHELHLLERERRLGRFEAGVIDARLQETRDLDAQAREQAERDGMILPDKLVDPFRHSAREDTWTGLSDRAMFESLQLADWREAEYFYFSTIVHAQATSLIPITNSIMDGKLPATGPHHRTPVAVVATSYNAVKYAMLAMMKLYDRVDLDGAVQQADEAMERAIEVYRQRSGIDAHVTEILGPRAGPPERTPRAGKPE